MGEDLFIVLEVIFFFSYKMPYIVANILTLNMDGSTYRLSIHSLIHLFICEINTILNTTDIKINTAWDLPSKSIKFRREERYIG